MVTGCDCHDPVVFGHRELCEAGTWFRDPARYRPRGEDADRALDRRLAELRAGQIEQELRTRIMADRNYMHWLTAPLD